MAGYYQQKDNHQEYSYTYLKSMLMDKARKNFLEKKIWHYFQPS